MKTKGLETNTQTIERLQRENARLAAAFQNVVAYLATEKGRCSAMVKKCEKEGDTHGTNFHQGMFSGYNQADIAIQAKNLFYLRDLLAPTIELLEEMDNYTLMMGAKKFNAAIEKELARLRAITKQ